MDTLKGMDIWPSREQIELIPDEVFTNFGNGEVEELDIEGEEWDLVVLDMNSFSEKYELYKGDDRKVYVAGSLEMLTDIGEWMKEYNDQVYVGEITSDQLSLIYPQYTLDSEGERVPTNDFLQMVVKTFYAEKNNGNGNGKHTSSELTNVRPQMSGEKKIYKIGNNILAMTPPTDPEELYKLELRHKELGLPEHTTVTSGD